jgi:hypothetical protein
LYDAAEDAEHPDRCSDPAGRADSAAAIEIGLDFETQCEICENLTRSRGLG